MKRVVLACICILAFGSAAGFAQAPSEAPINLAAILDQPAVSGACPTSQSGALFAARGAKPGSKPGFMKAYCEALCGQDPVVSCSGSSCSAVNRNCPNEQGHVTCDGTTYWCSEPCPADCGSPFCCGCENTGSCFACCRCEGGTAVECGLVCG
jgi:hypothetical protein